MKPHKKRAENNRAIKVTTRTQMTEDKCTAKSSTAKRKESD